MKPKHANLLTHPEDRLRRIRTVDDDVSRSEWWCTRCHKYATEGRCLPRPSLLSELEAVIRSRAATLEGA